MSKKRMLVFCDGTGADANAITIPIGVGFAIGKWATNVVRLARSVKPASADGMQQLVFYQSGIGSVTDFNASTVLGTTTTQATGLAVATKIREAYTFLAQNFRTGDEICLFGFSRGAYTARKLAALIDALGLLETEDLGFFFQYWSKLVNGEKVSKPGRDTKINCVGVWDTVGSILGVSDALHIKDNELPASVTTALQAVSLQDNRYSFWPTLWVKPPSGLASGQTLTEIWFPGAHCDVGGGYEHHELADLPLFWMADQLTYRPDKDSKKVPAIVDLNLDFLWKCRSKTSDSWGKTQPHNAWKDLPAGWPKTRYDLCKSDFSYHESIKSAPTALVESFCMITLKDLKDKFKGSGGKEWEPSCPKLGTFEKKCKENWNTLNNTAITYETGLDLLNPVIWVKGDPMIPPREMIQNGITDGNVPMCIARALYNNGIYPGKIEPSILKVWFGYNGTEYSVTDTDKYEVLIGPERYVRWVPISGELDGEKLKGAIPVLGGKDSDKNLLYIARYNGNGGKVRMGANATYTYGGKELSTTSYDVLVYNNLGEWIPCAADFRTNNSQSTKTNTQVVTVAEMAYPPLVAVGLNKLDISKDKTIRIIAYADSISKTGFTAHLDTWSDTTLYNAGLSWLTIASNDPEYQCSSWKYHTTDGKSLPKTVMQRINFRAAFASQPKVFVGISGLNLGGNWYLAVSATDVDFYGFTIHVVTASDTNLYGINVDWVAYMPNKVSIWNGTFTYGGASHVQFGFRFLNKPKIFTALTQFDISNKYNLRVDLNTKNVTTSGMDVSIDKWSDTEFTSVTSAYLAVDTVVGA